MLQFSFFHFKFLIFTFRFFCLHLRFFSWRSIGFCFVHCSPLLFSLLAASLLLEMRRYLCERKESRALINYVARNGSRTRDNCATVCFFFVMTFMFAHFVFFCFFWLLFSNKLRSLIFVVVVVVHIILLIFYFKLQCVVHIILRFFQILTTMF